MRRLPTLTFLALCGIPTAGRPSVPTQEPAGEPQVVVTSWAQGELLPLEPQAVPLSSELPEGLQAPPGVKLAQYAQISLGEGQTLQVALDLVLDKELLWVDFDLDGHFREDQPLPWQKKAFPWTVDTEVKLSFAEATKPMAVPMQFRYATALKKKGLEFTTLAYRVGHVLLEQRLYAFALIDLQSQLHFDREQGIVLLIDTNADGIFDISEGGRERIAIGSPFFVQGMAWDFQVAASSGKEVTFRPHAEAVTPPPRRWLAMERPPTGVRAEAPEENFETLEARYQDILKQGRGPMVPTLTAIGALGSEEAFSILDKTARSKKAKIFERRAAIKAMGNVAYREFGGDKLRKLALDKEPQIAMLAIAALHAMDWPQREDLLLKLAKSRNDAIAKEALRFLAYLETPTATEAVIAAIQDDKTAREVRLAAYEGLRTWEAGPPVEGMRVAAASSYPPLSAKGLTDLFRLDPKAAVPLAQQAAALDFHNPTQLDAITRVLGATADEDSIDALLAMDTVGNSIARDLIRKLLSTLRSPTAVAAIGKQLESKEATQRELTASILGVIPIPESAQALAKQLPHESELPVEQTILEALGKLPFPASIDALLTEAKKSGPMHETAVRALAQVGEGDANVRALMASLLDTQNWEDQVMAIQAIAAAGDVALGAKLLPSLEDEEWAVRLAAIEGFRHLRSAQYIPPLIARVAAEPRLRLRLALGRTLFLITGQSPYWNAETWQKWWQQAKSSFVMPPEPPEPPDSHGGDTVVGKFFGITLSSDAVVFVIDKSGSMQAPGNPGKGTRTRSRNRMEEAIDEALGAIAGMQDRDSVNVILFSSGIFPWKRGLTELKERNRSKLEEFLRKQRPDGGTRLYDALEDALNTEGVDKILLLSDGQPSEGKFLGTEDILREVRRLNQTKRIAIDCVSLGGDSRLLRLLAEQNEGSYVSK